MAESLTDQVIRKIKQAGELYHRLLLVVAPAGAGKTKTLKEVQEHTGFQLINLNLYLSRRMLDLTERQRTLQLPRLLEDLVNNTTEQVFLLDNIEILFDVSLKQDPLRLLLGLSRNKTIVAAWNGSIDGNYLIFAEPSHQEYKRYMVRDFLVAGTTIIANDDIGGIQG